MGHLDWRAAAKNEAEGVLLVTQVGTKQRRALDDYPTPTRELEVLRDVVRRRLALAKSPRILEPSAGSGRVLVALQEEHLRDPLWSGQASYTAVEANAAYRPDLTLCADRVVCPEDFVFWSHRELRVATSPRYDLAVGNPPYSIAKVFLERCYDLLAPGGYLAFLLRPGIQESDKRREWMIAHPVTGKSIRSRRPSFTGDRGTDLATAYAWFVWRRPPERWGDPRRAGESWEVCARRLNTVAQWDEVLP